LEVTRLNRFLEQESLEKQRARLGIFNEAPFPTSEETSHRVGDSDLDRGPQMIVVHLQARHVCFPVSWVGGASWLATWTVYGFWSRWTGSLAEVEFFDVLQ
jgi:hypothetical protein